MSKDNDILKKGQKQRWTYIIPIIVWVIGIVLAEFVFDITKVNSGFRIVSMSLALVAIVTYISNQISGKISNFNKDDYYLGVNIKYMSFYNNWLLKLFNSVLIKIMFGIVAIVPVILMIPKLDIKWQWLKRIFNGKTIPEINYFLLSAWASSFVIASAICIALLIETVYLNKKVFDLNSLRSKDDIESSKEEARNQVKEAFIIAFQKSIKPYQHIYTVNNNLYRLLERHIFNLLHDAETHNEDDPDGVQEYLNLAFSAETDVVNNLIASSKRIPRLDDVFFSYINRYYQYKWEILACQKVISMETLLKIAYRDLCLLMNIERSNLNNEAYLIAFCHEYMHYEIPIVYMNESKQNTSVAAILGTISRNWRNLKCLSRSDDASCIVRIFELLDVIDKLEAKRKMPDYVPKDRSGYFVQFFDVVIQGLKGDNETDKNIEGKLIDCLNSSYCDLGETMGKIAYDHIVDNPRYSPNTLRFMLRFLSKTELVAALIHTLIFYVYSVEFMNVESYLVWRDAMRFVSRQIKTDLSVDDIASVCELMKHPSCRYTISDEVIKNVLKATNVEIAYMLNSDYQRGVVFNEFPIRCFVILQLMLNPVDVFFYNVAPDIKKRLKYDLKSIEDILEEEGKNEIFR